MIDDEVSYQCAVCGGLLVLFERFLSLQMI